jgi:DNA-binding ferritin-like protein
MSENYAGTLMPFVHMMYAGAIDTHRLHVNYKGANFIEVHEMLGEQYLHMIEEADSLMERVRMKGEEADLRASLIAAEDNDNTTLSEIRLLHRDLSEEARKHSLYFTSGCPSLANLLADIEDWHAKQAWIIASILGREV